MIWSRDCGCYAGTAEGWNGHILPRPCRLHAAEAQRHCDEVFMRGFNAWLAVWRRGAPIPREDVFS